MEEKREKVLLSIVNHHQMSVATVGELRAVLEGFDDEDELLCEYSSGEGKYSDVFSLYADAPAEQ